jgi:hypothetical protein
MFTAFFIAVAEDQTRALSCEEQCSRFADSG